MTVNIGKLISRPVEIMLVVNRVRRTGRQAGATERQLTLAEWLAKFAVELFPFAFWGLGLAYLLSSLPKPPTEILVAIGAAWFLLPFFLGRAIFQGLRGIYDLTSGLKRAENPQEREQFYSSDAWRSLRESVTREESRCCDECGILIKNSEDVTVDHILPRNRHPELALRRDNLRVLCRSCNAAA